MTEKLTAEDKEKIRILDEQLTAAGFDLCDTIEGVKIFQIEKTSRSLGGEHQKWELVLDVAWWQILTGVLTVCRGERAHEQVKSEVSKQFFDPSIDEVLALVKLLGLSPEVAQ